MTGQNLAIMARRCAVLGSISILALVGGLGGQAPGPEPDEGRGFFMAGVLGLDLDPLNAEFAERGLPALSTNFFTLGGGGHARFGRFLVGGEGHAVLGNTASAEGFERSVGGGFGFLNAGYMFETPGALELFSLVGVGAGRTKFKTVQVAAPSFGDILDDPLRGARLTQTSFLIQAALGTDWVIMIVEEPQELQGLTIGLRVGYVHAFRERPWRMEGFRVTDGPGLGFSGPYLRLSVGGVGPP